MSFDLSILGGFPTTTVKIRGVDAAVTMLSDYDMGLIAGLFPQPRAPMIKDPNRGSAAPSIADTQDEKYREAMRQWNGGVEAAAAGAMLDMEVPGCGSWSTCRGADAVARTAYLKAAAVYVRANLGRGEIERVIAAAARLATAATAMEEEAKKD